MRPDIQLDSDGGLHHFLTLEGLTATQLSSILDTAESFYPVAGQSVRKVPLLRGKTIVNLFFENSTRTRTTFEVAAKKLSADVINFNLATSATSKGESLLDTLKTLEAMQADMFVVRHQQSGAAHFIARHVAPHVSVINAGDGRHAHPTQAMLDMLTIRHHKGAQFERLKIAIIGDILHSRVARSLIHGLNILGVGQLRVVAPDTLLPNDIETLGVHPFNRVEQGIKDVDVIIMLRLQKERMQHAMLSNEHEYFRLYGLTEKRLALAKPDVIVMHPGPINRGVELDSVVADGPHSVILDQVSHGIATRMAIMAMTLGYKPDRVVG